MNLRELCAIETAKREAEVMNNEGRASRILESVATDDNTRRRLVAIIASQLDLAESRGRDAIAGTVAAERARAVADAVAFVENLSPDIGEALRRAATPAAAQTGGAE